MSLPPAQAPEPQATESSDTEREIAVLWATLLGKPRIESHESFFGLGADSLLALRMTWAVSAHFNIDLHLLSIYRAPTLAEFAHYVDGLLQGTESSSL